MIDERERYERAFHHFEMPEPAWDRLFRRRDRKRRNQRIAAGIVGIAVFVAAVWIVMSGAVFDRTETPAVPGPNETGPTETGPTESPGDQQFGFEGLPPEGAEPSTPVHGKLIWSDFGIQPWRTVQVYADGRVIWLRQTGSGATSENAPTTGWLERRLTPEAVRLVRSGAVPETVSAWMTGSEQGAGVWEDGEAKPYVPSRYEVCDDGAWSEGVWSQETVRLLPQHTQDLFRAYTNGQALVRGCPAVTIEEARALDRIFLEVGFERVRNANTGEPAYVKKDPDGAYIDLTPVLPNGKAMNCCPG